MRVLIVAAILAFARAAPSGVFTHVAHVIPSAAVDLGDVEAAAINAKVLAEDQAIAAIDKARELKDLAIENHNEKVEEVNDIFKARNEELFWSVEDKKWQAIDALKTAEAQIDGSVANNADILARSTYGGVIVPSYLTSLPQVISPQVISPITYAAPSWTVAKEEKSVVSPIAYATPGIVAPAKEEEKLVKTAEPEKIEEVKTEKVEEMKPEWQKKAEEENAKLAKKTEEIKAEWEKQSEEARIEFEKRIKLPIVPSAPVLTNLAIAPGYQAVNLASPWAEEENAKLAKKTEEIKAEWEKKSEEARIEFEKRIKLPTVPSAPVLTNLAIAPGYQAVNLASSWADEENAKLAKKTEEIKAEWEKKSEEARVELEKRIKLPIVPSAPVLANLAIAPGYQAVNLATPWAAGVAQVPYNAYISQQYRTVPQVHSPFLGQTLIKQW